MAVVGAVSYLSMPLEAFPDVEIPFVMVMTRYRGVSPLDVERSITVKIEEELKGLSDVRNITSTSAEGSSTLVVEFDTGVDMTEALRRVKERVDRAKGDLPGDLDSDPEVLEISNSEIPVVSVVLSGPVGLPLLKKIAEDYKADFEGLPQVVEAEISGGLEREIVVAVDSDRASGYNLPITQLNAAVAAENQSVSGGAIRMGAGRYQLRVPGEFESPGEAQRIVVAVVDNQPVYLDDVAHVYDGFKDETSRSRINYVSAVTIGVKKRSGGNVVELVDEVDRILERRKRSLPGGVTAVKVNDFAKFIRWLVKDLENNLLSGFFLVLFVVFFTMGFRNALLVSLSIPLSMLIAFAILDTIGVTLNMIVLFSMTLALGMLVDNAIVIIENIYRFMQAGVPRIRAACRATSEVAWPIIGSSLTTIAAFAPLLFWPGIMGSVMKYLPQTVITTLAACLLVALVVNPALAATFMKRPEKAEELASEDGAELGGQPVAGDTGFTMHYRRTLAWSLRRRSAVLVTAVLVLILCVTAWVFFVGLEKPVQLMPSVDPDNAYIQIKTPEGADLEYNDAVVREVEKRVRGAGGGDGRPSDLVDIDKVLAKASLEGGSGFGPGSGAANQVALAFADMEDREWPSGKTIEVIRERLKDFPGAEISVIEEEKGPPTGSPVNIEVVGQDLEILGRIAGEIRKRIVNIPFVNDVRDDFVAGVPTVRVRVDRKKAALVGLNTMAVGMALKIAFNGIRVSTYREGGEDYDIVVRLPDADRNTASTLRRFFIPSPSGELVPLTTIAEIVYEGGYASISRKNHERTVTVTATVDEKMKPGPVARAEAEEAIASLRETLGREAPGYDVRFTGQFEFQKDAQEFLGRAFLIALLAIAVILVAIFNSVTHPFVIMSSVVLSTGGAFLGLAAAGLPFVIVMSGVGVIALAGVVVNNAIVLVDYTGKLRGMGYSLDDAVVAAGATRLRPVLLTAVTTVLGLVPLVVGVAFDFRSFRFVSASESSQWWRPMAVCVIFGLALATVLTLVVVPCLYHAIESAKARLRVARGFLDSQKEAEEACR
jgi:multidrug efflux pump subunit AcrB